MTADSAAPGAEPLPILLLNGPNLNTLGVRQPHVYGSTTLTQIVESAERRAAERGFGLRSAQTNHEGQLIDWIHEARGQVSGIIINPGGWTHTSVALADALLVPEVPIVEVHISNVAKRESFRHHSYVSPIAVGTITGLGVAGYDYAVQFLTEHLSGQGSRA
ncbi:type II 3-dehydroquinate dehydratase [Gordonia sp. CPCC 205333]|uniref:type II 3-dehydroquinate dehydratase n=1 Tax=Gordonia sp. CPCC 205333 TaxID=3140790 RepID=UPI003AF35B6F